jgi:hypothetical protein
MELLPRPSASASCRSVVTISQVFQSKTAAGGRNGHTKLFDPMTQHLVLSCQVLCLCLIVCCLVPEAKDTLIATVSAERGRPEARRGSARASESRFRPAPPRRCHRWGPGHRLVVGDGTLPLLRLIHLVLQLSDLLKEPVDLEFLLIFQLLMELPETQCSVVTAR